MILDFHTHFFPDALAPRAIAQLAATAQIVPCTDGTLAGTLARMTEAGVDMAVGLHIATNPGQMHKVNDFAAASQSNRMACFGSVHPKAPDALDELHRIKELGLKGVKLHPDYQGFFVDDPAMAPLYETAARLGLSVLFHAGKDPLCQEVHATPRALAQLALDYPDLTVIVAHMGGLLRYEESMEYLVGSRVYLDVSMSCTCCPDGLFAQMVARHPKDRLLFATDCPWSRAEDQIKKLRSLNLSRDDLNLILWENGQRILSGR